MEMSSALMYSLRYSEKLVLPEIIKQSILKLRLVPASYRPLRGFRKEVKKIESGNWREKILIDCVRKVREVLDKDYDEIFKILNIISGATLDNLSKRAIEILKSRDQEFRLRVTTLLFDKSIKGSVYASIMSEFAKKLNEELPEISEDLEIQVKMFGTIYDMNETLLFPSLSDPSFDDKVVAWSKQKDIRRGYSRFLTNLYIRNLVSGNVLHESMNKVIVDLEDAIVQPKTDKMEENITQYADFLYEIAKLLPKTAVELRGLIQIRLDSILKRPRTDFPSLNMRSRFKLEDTFKCVQAS
jgi:hypothetical protein